MTHRKVTFFLSVVAGLLGLAHIALTALIYASWNTDALWFIGTGFAIVIAASANIVAINALDRPSRSITIIINLMMAGFFVAAWPVLPGPQVIIGGLLFAGLAVSTLGNPTLSISPSA